jgi:hypothetical protein
MSDRQVVSAAELEQLSPNERAKVVHDRSAGGLSDLDPAFREAVEETGRRLLEERGLLDPDRR